MEFRAVSPINVVVETDDGLGIACGVIPHISRRGACVWTDAPLAVGATL